ncbi:MAG: hypothetical protein HYT27_00130 [Parcubacteria group bacterium]|nr:hypothetical protein [Parcubacteria group bacterium]
MTGLSHFILTTILLLIATILLFLGAVPGSTLVPGIFLIGVAFVMWRVIFVDIRNRQRNYITEEIRHNVPLWENTFMDTLRRKHCLCLNCAKLKPGQPDNCPIAQAGFELCKKYNTAYAMTRCPEWVEKSKINHSRT